MNEIKELFEFVVTKEPRTRYLSLIIAVNVNPNGISRMSFQISGDFDGIKGGKCLGAAYSINELKGYVETALHNLPSLLDLKKSKIAELEFQLKELKG